MAMVVGMVEMDIPRAENATRNIDEKKSITNMAAGMAVAGMAAVESIANAARSEGTIDLAHGRTLHIQRLLRYDLDHPPDQDHVPDLRRTMMIDDGIRARNDRLVRKRSRTNIMGVAAAVGGEDIEREENIIVTAAAVAAAAAAAVAISVGRVQIIIMVNTTKNHHHQQQ